MKEPVDKVLGDVSSDSRTVSEFVRKLESGRLSNSDFQEMFSSDTQLKPAQEPILKSLQEVPRDKRFIRINGNAPDLQHLREFEQLEILWLHLTLSPKNIPHVASLTQLKELQLSVGSPNLEEFSSLKNLERLFLSQCPRMKSIRGLEKFPKLETFHLHYHNTLDSLSPFLELEHLTKLEMSGIQSGLKVPSLSALSQLKKLKTLKLQNLLVADGSLEPLMHFQQLEELCLEGYFIVSWLNLEQYAEIVASYPKIDSLKTIISTRDTTVPCKTCERPKWWFLPKDLKPLCQVCERDKIETRLQTFYNMVIQALPESLASDFREALQSYNDIDALCSQTLQKEWNLAIQSENKKSQIENTPQFENDDNLGQALLEMEKTREKNLYQERTKEYRPPFLSIFQNALKEDDLEIAPRIAKHLYVRGDNTSFKKIVEFETLESLSIYKLSAKNSRLLKELPHLKQLCIRHLSSPDLTPLSHLTSLYDLILYQSSAVKSVTGIETLQNLRTFALADHNQVDSLDPLSQLSSLIGLHISRGLWNAVKVGTLGNLERLTRLQYLCFTDVVVSDGNYIPLTKFENLQELIFSGPGISLEIFAKMAATYPCNTELQNPVIGENKWLLCKKCGKPKLILLGKGSRSLCSTCQGKRLEKFQLDYRQLIDSFQQ